jgi:hypothetical protein
MLMPTDSLAAAKSLGDLEFIEIDGLNDIEAADEESR